MSLPKKLLLLFVVLGTIDAAYLTVVHYTKLPFYCPESGVISCIQVTTSALSVVAGIPIAVAGLVWFIGLGVIVFLMPKIKVARNIWILLGFGGVAYSVIGQIIISAICEYCIALDVLIIMSTYLLIRHRKTL